MISQQAVSYIKARLQANVPSAEIEKAMADQGWQYGMIQENIEAVRNDPDFAHYFNHATASDVGIHPTHKALLVLLAVILLGTGGALAYVTVKPQAITPSTPTPVAQASPTADATIAPVPSPTHNGNIVNPTPNPTVAPTTMAINVAMNSTEDGDYKKGYAVTTSGSIPDLIVVSIVPTDTYYYSPTFTIKGASCDALDIPDLWKYGRDHQGIDVATPPTYTCGGKDFTMTINSQTYVGPPKILIDGSVSITEKSAAQ